MLPIRANYKELTHHSITAQVCASVAFKWNGLCGCISPALVLLPPTQLFILHFQMPRAFLYSFHPTHMPNSALCLLPVFGFIFWSPFPCSCCLLHFAGIQHFAASSGLQLFFISHYFWRAIIKIIFQTLGKSCSSNWMEITQLGSVPTEPPLLGRREKFHSGKLKTFISHTVLQHIFKEPCFAQDLLVSFWYSHFPPHILFYLLIEAVCGASSFWAVVPIAGEMTPQARVGCFDHGF